eukprot:6043005-Amphidinium_carterae.1
MGVCFHGENASTMTHLRSPSPKAKLKSPSHRYLQVLDIQSVSTASTNTQTHGMKDKTASHDAPNEGRLGKILTTWLEPVASSAPELDRRCCKH